MKTTDDIPLDDPRAFKLLSEGRTLGIFQLGSPGMRGLLKKVQPSKLEDVSAVLALYRPGPMDNDSHTEYAKRKARGMSIPTIHPELNDVLQPVLAETYGLIVYQEQVMSLINRVTGWGYAEAESVFTAMRKKKRDLLDSAKPAFAAAGVAQGFSVDAVQTLWEVLVPFSDYSFNKAHSMGYAYLAYWGAYLKSNHPVEFTTAFLTGCDNKELPSALDDARANGIKLLPPDVNTSGLGFTATKEGVRYGLASIKGLADASTSALIARRPYASIDDFFRRADAKVLNGRVLEALGKSGSLDSLWGSREELVQQAGDVAQLALNDRKARRTGERKLTQVRYRPSKANGQAQGKDSGLRAEWERSTLGMVLTFPDLTLTPLKPLQPEEWTYVRQQLARYPGDSPVTWGKVKMGTAAHHQGLIDSLALVGVELTAQ